jgi:pimeloyl-ACP methyl ester carboxylesterase
MKDIKPLLLTVAVALSGAAGAFAADGAKYTFVVVHGATAGGWEWKRTGQFLTDDGHTVYRATLTGLGERMHLNSPEINLETHVMDVVNLILFEDLHDVVLTGHSYGGMVAVEGLLPPPLVDVPRKAATYFSSSRCRDWVPQMKRTEDRP